MIRRLWRSGNHLAGSVSASTGQAEMHMPQPLHSVVSMCSSRCRLMTRARAGQRPIQDWQITPFQARQVSRFSCRSPMRGAGRLRSSRSSSTGQASTQAAQNVQPVSQKSSQGIPARVCSAGCRRRMPGSQAATQGCAQPGQQLSSGSLSCQGGGGPSACWRCVS